MPTQIARNVVRTPSLPSRTAPYRHGRQRRRGSTKAREAAVLRRCRRGVRPRQLRSPLRRRDRRVHREGAQLVRRSQLLRPNRRRRGVHAQGSQRRGVAEQASAGRAVGDDAAPHRQRRDMPVPGADRRWQRRREREPTAATGREGRTQRPRRSRADMGEREHRGRLQGRAHPRVHARARRLPREDGPGAGVFRAPRRGTMASVGQRERAHGEAVHGRGGGHVVPRDRRGRARRLRGQGDAGGFPTSKGLDAQRRQRAKRDCASGNLRRMRRAVRGARRRHHRLRRHQRVVACQRCRHHVRVLHAEQEGPDRRRGELFGGVRVVVSAHRRRAVDRSHAHGREARGFLRARCVQRGAGPGEQGVPAHDAEAGVGGPAGSEGRGG